MHEYITLHSQAFISSVRIDRSTWNIMSACHMGGTTIDDFEHIWTWRCGEDYASLTAESASSSLSVRLPAKIWEKMHRNMEL
jgi:hypothetical protein